MKQKLIVCGASKNLGKFIAEKFEKKNLVFKLGRSNSKSRNYIRCNFLDLNELDQTLRKIKNKFKNIDGVIFCIGDSKKYYKKNDDITFWKKSMETNASARARWRS